MKSILPDTPPVIMQAAFGDVRVPGYCGQVILVGRVGYGLGLRRLRPACLPFGCGRAWRS